MKLWVDLAERYNEWSPTRKNRKYEKWHSFTQVVIGSASYALGKAPFLLLYQNLNKRGKNQEVDSLLVASETQNIIGKIILKTLQKSYQS